MQNYVSKAIKALKRPENLGKAGNAIRCLSIPAGAVPAAIAYATTGDAVAATHAMQPAAYGFFLGEALKSYGEYANQTGSNFMQHAGRALSTAIPLAAAQFLGDNVYDPVTDIGSIGAWAVIGQGMKTIGNGMRENAIMKKYLSKGRGAMLSEIESLSDEEIARFLAKNR